MLWWRIKSEANAGFHRLKQRLEENPTAKTPELQFVTEQDWLDVASKKLDTGVDYRRALVELRSKGETKFGQTWQKAGQKFPDANKGEVLTSFAQ